MRARDRAAMDSGIPGYTLMTRAAAAALEHLRARWPTARRLLVLCGMGNNGGDGLVLARLAAAAGLDPQVRLLAVPERLTGDALLAWRDLQDTEVPVIVGPDQALDGQALAAVDVVVDALFGIGLVRPIEGAYAGVIRAVAGQGLPVMALDVPSGLCSASGQVLGCALRADLTITFVERKIGHYLGVAQDYVGALHLERLGIEAVLAQEAPGALARLLPAALLEQVLQPRSRVAHKGSHGHLLVVGGAPGMAGAVRLAGEAALHAGAGLVTVATSPAHAELVNIGRPELMCHGVGSGEALAPLLARADVVVAGPGLGREAWATEMLGAATRSQLPLVLDADALNLLAAEGDDGAQWLASSGRPTVLTPHPGEAGRLLGRGTGEVQADRLGAHQSLVDRYGAVVVLKGAGSLVGAPGWMPHLCDLGNPAMAVAGMGDVLSGVLGGLLAQDIGGDAFESTCAGVLVHAMAGDLAVRRQGGERGLLAGEMAPLIRECLNVGVRRG